MPRATICALVRLRCAHVDRATTFMRHSLQLRARIIVNIGPSKTMPLPNVFPPSVDRSIQSWRKKSKRDFERYPNSIERTRVFGPVLGLGLSDGAINP